MDKHRAKVKGGDRHVMTDEQLVQHIAHGDEASMEALVYRYHKPIYIYLQRMLNDRELAEDLSQECFVRLYRSIKSGRIPTRFRPWIYRIAANLCKDVWKSSAYRKEVLEEAEKLSLHSDGETVTSILERQWRREAVVRALKRLTVEEREIIVLRFYQDLKLDEVAETLQLPLGSVKSKLYRTFKKLANLLEAEEAGRNGSAFGS